MNIWVWLMVFMFVYTGLYSVKREFFGEDTVYNQNKVKNEDVVCSDVECEMNKIQNEVKNIQDYILDQQYIKKEERHTLYPPNNKGIKYTIFDVNKAIDAIKLYFVENEGAHVHITKIVRIINGPNDMVLKLFVYNLEKNVMLGYDAKVSNPINKKEKRKVIEMKRFTEDKEEIQYKEKQNYQGVNFLDGFFT
jgi:hypothetical protein